MSCCFATRYLTGRKMSAEDGTRALSQSRLDRLVCVCYDRATSVTNVLAFILPIQIVTLAQFPFVSDTILQWLEPITRVLR